MTNENDCGYCNGITDLRAAEQTEETPQESPEQLFEQHFRNMRATQLEAEREQLDVDAEDEIRALAEHRREVKADLSPYEAPDAYKLRGSR